MSLKSLSIAAYALLVLCGGGAQAQIAGLANGGFEVAADGKAPGGVINSPNEFAEGWLGSNKFQATRSSADAHSGSWSALIRVPDPGLGGSGLFQNSVDHGGLLAVDSANWGSAPTLSFWIKGNASFTGNLNYALRYLNSNGVILNTTSSISRTIWTGDSLRDWTQIWLAGIVIPVNTAAVFLEMTLAVGPTGPQPPGNCGVDPISGLPYPCDFGQAAVFLDDVNLTLAHPVAAIPEPESYALMLSGLGVLGSIIRRRRSV